MKIYTKKFKQNLPINIDVAWEFISEPNNLKTITPDNMGFEIIGGNEKKMFPGQIIQYYVSPFPVFKLKWVTEITHVVDKHYFVDEQRFGPYSFWHHKHFLKEIEGGVEMEDVIDYKLPFGILGQILHFLYVNKKLDSIFEFRKNKLISLFGNF